MLLDALDSLNLFACGVYEPLETRIFKRLINRNDVVFDVGANIGYYTLIATKLVGEKGRVFAFEPEPTNFSLLEKNVKLNGYKNVVLMQKAVLNKTGKTKLYLHRTAGGHSKTQSFTSNIEVETVSLIFLGSLTRK